MNWAQVEPKLYNVGNFFSLKLAHILFDAANALPDNSLILEIGAFQGFSTIALACGCVDTHKRVITIDNFCGRIEDTNQPSDESYYATFLENIESRGLKPYVNPMVGDSSKFYNWDFKLGMLFIDGNHELMRQDFDAFFPSLVSGGIVMLHDIDRYHEVWEGIAQQIRNPQIIVNMGMGVKP